MAYSRIFATGILSLFFPLSALAAAATEEPAPVTTRVPMTARECETLLAPHAFSVQKARAHRAWHDAHPSASLGLQAWITMHTDIHRMHLAARHEHTQRVIACFELTKKENQRRMANLQRRSMALWSNRGLFPYLLPQTGGVSPLRRDDRFAGPMRPTRRTIEQRTEEEQESRRRY